MTFIDQLRELNFVPLHKKKALYMPLVAGELTSTVQNVGYREAEVIDIVIKIGGHNTVWPDGSSNEQRAEAIRQVQKAIAAELYGDIHRQLHRLRAEVSRIDDMDIRHSMEMLISDAFAVTEI